MVNLNVMWLGFVFVLISFVHMHGAVLVQLFVGEGGGGRGVGSFKIGRPRSRGWKSFGHRWTAGWGVLKIRQFSWTSYAHRPLLGHDKMSLYLASICKDCHAGCVLSGLKIFMRTLFFVTKCPYARKFKVHQN